MQRTGRQTFKTRIVFPPKTPLRQSALFQIDEKQKCVIMLLSELKITNGCNKIQLS
jgi:hypothetical protein